MSARTIKFPKQATGGHRGRPAVEITFEGQTFYIDDEAGSGWHCVTHRFSSDGGYKRLPTTSTLIVSSAP